MRPFIIFVFIVSNLACAQVLDRFPIPPSPIAITRLVQPQQYFDKVGRKAAIMGWESGTFECWIWHWKVLRNFELSFLLGTSTQPILARDVARTITVSPEATTITYSYESFSVTETIIVPQNESGVILLLDVHTTMPLTIVSGFLPVMQPQWPAGIGGQHSYWVEDAHSFVISESQKRAIFLCGSPLAQKMAAPPAHMFSDAPLQFKIDVQPNEFTDQLLPIVIAGGTGMSMDEVKALQKRLWTNAEKLFKENQRHFQRLHDETIQITTPDKDINLAFEWAKVAQDNLMVHHPTLGNGLVAGYGLSGGSARPGFAWFFSGDTYINCQSLNSFGAFETVRDALAFTQKWQRQENFPVTKKKAPEEIGKMAHELSLSDGLVDWWNDYPYGYIHADTTPWYIVAMGDYLRWSGDVDFITKSFPSLRLAYDWCLKKDSDGDGLMDLKGAGLGALEFGKLVGIYADAYTSMIFARALEQMSLIAEAVGEKEISRDARERFEKAKKALETKFWIGDLGYYCYGATEKNEQVREKTPWATIGMAWNLLDPARTKKSIEAFNGSELCADWGTRSLARSSSLFEPMNYNYGAIWSFISSFFATAQYEHHFSHAGFASLQAVAAHTFDHGCGVIPEVFSGETNQKIGEGYHHQGFSTTGFVLPLIRGLFGLEINGLDEKIILKPHLPPDWKNVSMKNIRIDGSAVSFTMINAEDMIELTMEKDGRDRVELLFSPALELGSEITSVTVNGKPATHEVIANESDLHPTVRCTIDGTVIIQMHVHRAPTVFQKEFSSPVGSTNTSLKFISQSMKGSTIRYIVEGLSGKEYTLGVMRSIEIENVQGARLVGDTLIVTIPNTKKGSFIPHEIILSTKITKGH